MDRAFFLCICRRITLLFGVALVPSVHAELHSHGGWEVCACKRWIGDTVPFDPDADHVGNGRKYAGIAKLISATFVWSLIRISVSEA